MILNKEAKLKIGGAFFLLFGKISYWIENEESGEQKAIDIAFFKANRKGLIYTVLAHSDSKILCFDNFSKISGMQNSELLDRNTGLIGANLNSTELRNSISPSRQYSQFFNEQLLSTKVL